MQEYEAKGFKDVVWVDRDETVTVEAWYAPWDGVYMFHCHNLVHEDHYMMDAFNVTQIADLGYNETEFNDPMEARWRAKPVDSADFTPEAITDTVQYMASLKPYSDWQEVEEKLVISRKQTDQWSNNNHLSDVFVNIIQLLSTLVKSRIN